MTFTKNILSCVILLNLGMFVSCKTSQVVTEKSQTVPQESQQESLEQPESLVKEIQPDPTALKNLILQKELEIQNYKGSRERKFDLLHTSLDLRFDYERQWVQGKALLTLKPFIFDQQTLELDAKDFEIHNVWLQEAGEERPLALRYNSKIVTIYLPQIHTSKDTLMIGMRYTAKPNENSGLGSEAITDTKGLYFINPEGKEGKPVQIWTQGETEHNSKWFPTIDSPNERATHDIRVTVENQYASISNGKLLSKTIHDDGTRTDHWEMDQAHAPYLTALVVGKFAFVLDSLGKLPLRYIVEQEYAAGAKKVFENTPKMMEFFSTLLGVDFPWPKYDQIVVRDFVSGAMENTTASIFMEGLNLDQREAIDSEWDYIIAHELFHQWFGNYVTMESWSNLPLNESFADYSEYLWMEHHEGKDVADMYHMVGMEGYFSEAEEKQVDLIRFQYNDPEDMFDNHSYAKGGRILHMLRRYLGDEAFFASLNLYLEQHAYSSVEIHDLRLAFEKTSGRDLNWFFNQWFLSSGHPVLDIQFDLSQPDNILLTVKQMQNLASTPLYKLPFTVAWYQKGQRKEASFILDQAVQQFALENGANTDLVVFDESMVILAKKDSYRGREHFEKQAVLAEAGISRYEALDSLANKYSFGKKTRQLFSSALNDSFSSIRELALARILSGEDSMPLTAEEEERVLEMVEADPDNTVRAGAIDLLNKTGKDKYASLFLEYTRDSSYYVAGAALTAYLENEDNLQKENLVDGYLDTDNVHMLVPLAENFIRNADTGQSNWFREKLKNLSGEALYHFIGYYGEYFSSIAALDNDIAIQELYEVAKNNPAGYVRLAAFQALLGFMDEEGVLEKARELHAGEKDGRVKKYQSFFLGTDANAD